jgi:hypothetical protein
MSKVQRRSYGSKTTKDKSTRSTLYKHLIADVYAEKILSHLDVGFEKNLFLASLRNLSDHGNPVRFNNFAYCMREIISIILAKYSSDDDIKNCCWYEQPSDTEVTRVQRVTYAICGGMDVEYVKNSILEIEEDEEDILSETLSSFNKKFRDLNKFTHVRSAKHFDISDIKCEELSKAVLKLTSDIVSLIDECRREIKWKIDEQISDTVVDTSVQTTMDGLDILSSHGMVNYIDLDEYSVNNITSQSIEVVGSGTAYCILEWGSGSDMRRGDGASIETDFPYSFKAFVSLSNLDDIVIPENHMDIDNSSWFE